MTWNKLAKIPQECNKELFWAFLQTKQTRAETQIRRTLAMRIPFTHWCRVLTSSQHKYLMYWDFFWICGCCKKKHICILRSTNAIKIHWNIVQSFLIMKGLFILYKELQVLKASSVHLQDSFFIFT